MDNQAMKPSNFWNNSTIVRLPGEALCSWRYRMGSGFNFDRFTDRFLTPVDKYADLIICAKQCNKYCGFRKIVRRRDGTFEAYCPEDPADAFVIDQQEVLLYNIRESTLVEEIARSLNITPYMAKLSNHEHSWKVGNIIVRGESHSVFFTLQWGTELLELILELNRLMHNPYVLLGSSGHMYNNVVAGCLANGDAVFVPLNETIDFNQDAELEQMRPFSWEKLLLSPEALTEEPENIFRKCGDAWEIRYDGGEKFMLTGVDTGARYIHYLLQRPGIKCNVIDIVREAFCNNIDSDINTGLSVDELNNVSIVPMPTGVSDSVFDKKAIEQYRTEASQLLSDIEDARNTGEAGLTAQLHDELDLLIRSINEAISPKGQERKLNDYRRNVESAFRNAVNRVIRKVKLHDIELCTHFRTCIQCGTTPVYLPGDKTIWQL